MHLPRLRSGFTLIELLTVITIIAILMGLLIPAAQLAIKTSMKVSAKNDLTQLVTAVNGFYNDYGVYPVDPGSSVSGNPQDAEWGDPNGLRPISDVVNVLRADNQNSDTISTGSNPTPLSINTRQVSYLPVSFCKDMSNPKSGLGNGHEAGNSNGGKAGQWYDPFGATYMVCIDTNYDGYTVAKTFGNYSDITFSQDANGNKAIQIGCIAGSYGSDHQIGTNGDKKFSGSDDILSWQR
jgi:prepilin-type N-terminal cleavage/methylation domain-containing protein